MCPFGMMLHLTHERETSMKSSVGIQKGAAMDNTGKFTGKGAVYAAARPRFAEGLLEYLASKERLEPGALVADVGSGTGIFSEQLLDAGLRVIGVEPNADMRAQAERALCGRKGYRSVCGTTDAMGLPDDSVDCVTAAQAFHWFDAEAFKRECRRVLKPGGFVAIVYNMREMKSPYMQVFAQLTRRFCPAFKGFSNGLDEAELPSFFDGPCDVRWWANPQLLTHEAFVARALSSSRAPREDNASYLQYLEELNALFDRFAEERQTESGLQMFLSFSLRTTLHAGRVDGDF